MRSRVWRSDHMRILRNSSFSDTRRRLDFRHRKRSVAALIWPGVGIMACLFILGHPHLTSLAPHVKSAAVSISIFLSFQFLPPFHPHPAPPPSPWHQATVSNIHHNITIKASGVRHQPHLRAIWLINPRNNPTWVNTDVIFKRPVLHHHLLLLATRSMDFHNNST